jgi:branched-chain amino acid transport system substrate-binding protein
MDANNPAAPSHAPASVGDGGSADGPPADVRTFLIADVRGYTRFTQEHGDEEAAGLAHAFADLTGEVVTASGGQLLELRGDEALAVFGSARQALRGAVELQRRFREQDDGRPVFPLGIGIGLDAGEAVPIQGGYRGAALNVASRLCALAEPGQILATETVVSLAQKVEGIRFVERRPVRVKGVEKPVRLIEIVPELKLPPVPRVVAPSFVARARQRPRALVLFALGTALLVASITAAIVELTASGDSLTPVGNAVAAIDPRGHVLSYTPVGTSPSNVVVGEGAVWVLNADDQTVSRIDLNGRQITKTFGTGQTPTDIAAGEGSVWVGNANAGDSYTANVSKIDPQTGVVGRTLRLTSPSKRIPPHEVIPGASELAVGAGALWLINPDLSVSRVDPTSGDVVARVPVSAGSAITADQNDVWLVGDGFTSVVRINPKTNRPSKPIEVGANFLADIALGAGSVWVSAPENGVVWRIDPAPRPIMRTVSVGRGATSIAFADGALWVTNTLDGTVLQIDPATNTVTKMIHVPGSPVGIAVAQGTTWVSLVGGTTPGALPSSACGEIQSGGGAPDVLIASDLPLRGYSARETQPMAAAILHVLREHDFKAGEYTVGYQSCDDSTSQTNEFEFFKCSSNAKAYAGATRLVGLIGTLNSGCAFDEIPIVNRGSPGPLAMISPANTYAGLTHAGPGTGPGEPGIFYPTGVRNYMRVTSADDVQGAAHALLARELGLRSVFVLDDGEPYGMALAETSTTAARRLGLTVAGRATWDARAPNYIDLARRIERSSADGILLEGVIDLNGAQLVHDLRAVLGPDFALIAADGFAVEALLHDVPREAIGMYTSSTAVAAQELTPAGRRFAREFAPSQPNGRIPTYVLETAQAAEILLQAISRSKGSRESVLEQLHATEVQDGILGTFRFDANGDKTPGLISVYRIRGKRPGDANRPPELQGTDFVRTFIVPDSLLQ